MKILHSYKTSWLFVLFFAATALANDGMVHLAGTVELIEDKKTNVSMKEEEIIITLHKDHYEIDVWFRFFNDGPNEKILIGFPATHIPVAAKINARDLEAAKKTMFRTYINEKLLQPDEYTIKEEYPENSIGIRIWLLRQVEFKGNSYTTSRVIYKMPYSEAGGAFYAGYIYGTGRSWKGPIGKMSVVVKHGDDVMVGGVGEGFNELKKPTSFIWEANGRYRYVFENVEPKRKDDELTVPIVFFDSKYKFECTDYGIFLCDLDRDFDGWYWSNNLLYKDPNDIMLFTKKQARLFINYFFAIHGYEFKNPYYRDYFQKYYGGKYQVNPNFSEKNFNEFERKNIDFLLKMESMIPVE